jgi:hypothetical protein
MKNHLLPVFVGRFALAAVALTLCSASGAPKAGDVKPAKPEANATKPAAEKDDRIIVPKSEFIIPSVAAEGSDPFFPTSSRMLAFQAKAVTDKGATKPASTLMFALKAITASGGRRVASINNRPFEAGEEGEIAFGATRVRLKCLEVREDSALIEVEGQTQELRLRPNR